ncbi:MAG: ABC transporter permease, partial [Acidimicrobiaceae bacterium]|nr:ABC transporter permease [Acidimicrobiaceae bacterium]
MSDQQTPPEAAGDSGTDPTASGGSATAPSRLHEAAVAAAMYLGCIVVALFASALIVWATGGSWQAVFSALLDGSLRAPGRWGETIGIAIPLVVVALGTAINGRAGVVNIGQEGQVMMGTAFATYVGVRMGGPGPVVIVCLLIVGALAGAMWAGIASWLLYWRRVPEVLTTLLLITVASQATGYALKVDWLLLAPFREDRSVRNQVSEQLAGDTRLPRIDIWGNDFPISSIAVVIMAVIVFLLFKRSVWGFRLRMLGRNARTAQRAGVSTVKYGTTAMLISGACAGLAGALMLSGGDFGNYRFTPGFANNIGWEGLLVALVARSHPVGVVIVAFSFAGLRAGSGFLAATGVEREISQVVLALLVLALL